MFSDSQVVAALILGSCTVLASCIAAAVAALIGRRFLKQEAIKSDLREAISDIAFLLDVEKEHAKIHRQTTGETKVRRVRAKVKTAGLAWSQRFTPGRAKNLKSLT